MKSRNEEMGLSRISHCILFSLLALIVGCTHWGFAWYVLFCSISVGCAIGYISFAVQEWFDYLTDCFRDGDF